MTKINPWFPSTTIYLLLQLIHGYFTRVDNSSNLVCAGTFILCLMCLIHFLHPKFVKFLRTPHLPIGPWSSLCCHLDPNLKWAHIWDVIPIGYSYKVRRLLNWPLNIAHLLGRNYRPTLFILEVNRVLKPDSCFCEVLTFK